MRLYANGGKRCLDATLALFALVVLSPILLVIAALIRSEDHGRVIFLQKRIGRSGEVFNVLKFRSMRENVGDVPSAQARALPVTAVGKVLRRTNLDELPQLINILKGEMSIVGPRPALPTQADLIMLRSESGAGVLRPGLTGLAQVSAYDGMPISVKAKLDAEYARLISLVGDLKIIARTVGYLFRQPPIY